MELGNLIFSHSRGEYPMPDREKIQKIWYEALGEWFDDYGFYEGENKTERGGFENEIFSVNPYYWGDEEEIWSEPNFIFKPTGFEAQWYKYPWRDAYANQEITVEQFATMVSKCKESLCTK